MINDILHIFSLDFMQRALLGGILLSVCCAILGIILVLKQFSMIGDGLSHVAFGSLAIATLLGFSPLKFTIPIVILSAFFLIRIKESSKINGDSAIAILSITSLAIGVVCISAKSGANTDVYNYMFGSLLSITNQDLHYIIILSILIIISYIYTYNKMFSITFDENFSKASGINVELHKIIIAILSSLTIVIGMKLMGALLISALIIFPALISMIICRTFKGVVILSVILSVITFCTGSLLSVIFDTPIGATIVVVDFIFFIIFTFVGNLLK